MGQILKSHFYYGAILHAIIQSNPDTSPTLILSDNSKQIYRVLTNASNKEYILFFKYAERKSSNTSSNYKSWAFSFSNDDKTKLNYYHNKEQLPILLCLLCTHSDLHNSKLAILTYKEYLQVANHQTITIGLESNKKSFYLFQSKSREAAYIIETNRITKKFDTLF